MINKNILKKIPRVRFYKKEVIYIIRGLLLFTTFIMLLVTFLRPYSDLLQFALNITLIYMMFSFTYFSFYATSKDRKTLINMWKIYFPSIFILIATVYSTDIYVTKTSIDHEKTKLDYYLKTKDFDEAKEVFEKYNKLMNSHLNTYGKEDVTESIEKSFSQKKSESNTYVLWYANIPVNLINLLNMLFIIWSFTELSLFSIKKKNLSYKKTYKFNK